jgi:hypothetical protein
MTPTALLTKTGFKIIQFDDRQKYEVSRPMEGHEFFIYSDLFLTIEPGVTFLDFFRAVLEFDYEIVQRLNEQAGCDFFAFAEEAIQNPDRYYQGTLLYRPRAMILRRKNQNELYVENDFVLRHNGESHPISDFPVSRIAHLPLRIESGLNELRFADSYGLVGNIHVAVKLREFVVGVLWDLSFFGETPAQRDQSIAETVPSTDEYLPEVEIIEETPPMLPMTRTEWVLALL